MLLHAGPEFAGANFRNDRAQDEATKLLPIGRSPFQLVVIRQRSPGRRGAFKHCVRIELARSAGVYFRSYSHDLLFNGRLRWRLCRRR